MKKLEDLILTYQNFPKKGIDFKDVLGIIQYPDVFQELVLKMSSCQFLINADISVKFISVKNSVYMTFVVMLK